jgi:hypothetical protein
MLGYDDLDFENARFFIDQAGDTNLEKDLIVYFNRGISVLSGGSIFHSLRL